MTDYKLVPAEIIDRFPEINTSNYGHDDVCDLNAWGVEIVLAAVDAPDVQGEPVALPPFATKIIEKLRRFDVCAEDGQDVDIGRHWLDMLVQLGLLNRVQRSPALWEMAQQGEDVLEDYTAPHPAEQKPAPGAITAGMLEAIWRDGFDAENYDDQAYCQPLIIARIAVEEAQPASDVAGLVAALEFYAEGEHFTPYDPDQWDTVSGEPLNFLHHDDGADGSAGFVENGSIAKAAIATHRKGGES